MKFEMACAEYPTYCNICKKGPFAGVIPAQQHFKSQTHLSKQALQNDRIQHPSGNIGAQAQQTYVSSCNACGKNFNNELSAEQHFASENHKKKQALVQMTQSNYSSFPVSMGRECDSPERSFYPSETPANDQHKSSVQSKGASNPKGPQNSTDHQNKNNPAQEYSFDGSRGYCYVCKIELTSPQHAKQHLNGKPHAKAKAAQSLDYQIKTVNAQHSPKTNTSGVRNEEYDFSGGRGYCYICKIELTSQAHAEQHLSGKNHEKAKAKRNTDVQNLLPLTCEICQKTFSGPESASQHFSSVKHRQKEALVQSHNPNSPPIINQNIPAFEVSPTDKTKWVICEVCNVRLNSVEQLNIHENSPKHKAEEEKLARMGSSIKVMNTPDFKMDAVKPRVQVQDTGFCPVKQKVDSVGLSDDLRLSLDTCGPSSFLSNQPGWFAQGEISLATMPPLSVSSLLTKPSQLPNMDDTLPKEVKFENSNFQSDGIHEEKSEEKNLKEKYPEKGLEKESINEKINTSSESSSLSSLDMPPLENYINNNLESGKKSNRNAERKANKDQENLLRKNSPLKSDGPRPPGAYPYQSDTSPSLSHSPSPITGNSKFSEKSYLSLANSNPTSLHQNVTSHESSMQKPNSSTDRSGGNLYTSISPERSPSKFGDSPGGDFRKVVTCNLGVSSENNAQTNTPQRVQRSRGPDIVKRVSNTKSRGSAKTGGANVALYDSSDSSDESEDQEEENKFFPCTSRDVIQKLQELNVDDSPTTPSSRVTESPVSQQRMPKYYCEICQCQMNAKKAYKDHMEGRKHMQKVAVMAAEPRSHRRIVKEVHDQGKTDCNLTLWAPRSYQWELYGRAMEGDRVVFLPTGTGKTLISCMAISAMLELNPTRQALFLVDKVLLVIQQSRYLVKQIGDRRYKRFDPDDPSRLVDRKLKIAALCGGQQSTDGVPIWQHDLIVVTAAYCDQLILKKVLRWEDLCMVVFDEAHHCTKSHPFNKQLENYHLTMDVQERPKILGLTASPAGKKTFPLTVAMLNHLMQSMGGAKIAVAKEHKAELERYQSSAELIVNYKPMSIKEQKFQKELQMYLLNCCLRLSVESNMLEQLDVGILPTHGIDISNDKRRTCAKELHGDILNSLEVTLNDAQPIDQSAAGRIQHRNLVTHTRNICIALNTLFETGVKTAVEELDELMVLSTHGNFDFARSISLKPDDLLSEIEIVQEMVQTTGSLPGSGAMIDPESQLSSRIVELLRALLNPNYIDWSQTHPIALVLVKERSSAKKMCGILQAQKEIVEKQLKVTHLVGHGGGSGEGGGMGVSQQKKILRDIKNHKYQIVIATSVAEEGIDIPECELVITMNLPSSVTALVQMRGRARKENSKFVVLCNDKIEEDRLSELMKKEDNMIKAANFLFDGQNKQEAKEN